MCCRLDYLGWWQISQLLHAPSHQYAAYQEQSAKNGGCIISPSFLAFTPDLANLHGNKHVENMEEIATKKHLIGCYARERRFDTKLGKSSMLADVKMLEESMGLAERPRVGPLPSHC
jgi:hypothetical protein